MRKIFLWFPIFLFVLGSSLSLFTTNNYFELQNSYNKKQLSNEEVVNSNVLSSEVKYEIFTDNLTTTSTSATVEYSISNVSKEDELKTLIWNNFEEPESEDEITIANKSLSPDSTSTSDSLNYSGTITTIDNKLDPGKIYVDTKLYAYNSEQEKLGKSEAFNIKTKNNFFNKKITYSLSGLICFLILSLIIIFIIIKKQGNKIVN